MGNVCWLLVDEIKAVVLMDEAGWLLVDWMKAAGYLDGAG